MARGDMTIRVDTRKLQQLERRSPGATEDGLDAMALEGKRIVQMSFNTSPAGRTYKRRGGRYHVASVAGYPPSIDTGKLMNAITIRKPGRRRRIISAGDTEYAVYLEFGTSKMDARPFMRPMVIELRERSAEFFEGRFTE